MKKLNSKGFGAVEVVILIVVIGVVAFGAYYVGHRTKSNDKTVTSPATSANAKTSTSTTTTATPASDTTAYVTIKEWNVKIPQNNVPQGFAYEVTSKVNNHVVFNSTDLKAAGCTLDGYGFIVARGTGAEVYNAEDGSKSTFKSAYDQYHANASTFHMHVGDYYYFDDAGFVCNVDQAKEAAAQKAIGDALKNIVSI
jgi:uncharacterized protein (UPF0333 family)